MTLCLWVSTEAISPLTKRPIRSSEVLPHRAVPQRDNRWTCRTREIPLHHRPEWEITISPSMAKGPQARFPASSLKAEPTGSRDAGSDGLYLFCAHRWPGTSTFITSSDCKEVKTWAPPGNWRRRQAGAEMVNIPGPLLSVTVWRMHDWRVSSPETVLEKT